MADAWNGSFGPSWGSSWGDGVTTSTGVDVGAGRVYYQGGKKRKHRKRIAENVREWIDEAYAEMTSPQAPKEVRVAAAKIVKPVANTKYAVPRASQVDWSALVEEQQKIQQLLSLYEKVDSEYRQMRAEIEDEDAVIMGLFL